MHWEQIRKANCLYEKTNNNDKKYLKTIDSPTPENIVLKSGKGELFKQIFDISLELIETKDREEDISELVIPIKELYESNLLSVADKNKILSLNGKLLKEHVDVSHRGSDFCAAFDTPHSDSGAIYFNL